MPKYDLTDYYLSEKQQYDTLINKIGRSNSGNLSFTSTTSGIVYNSTTGEQGLLVAIQNALKDYLINANDWNNLILNAGYFANDTGTANAYLVTLNPIPSSYQVGMMIKFKATNANTGASTINVNGLGAVSLVKDINVALVTGDILAGQIVIAIYDGTKFQIIPNYAQQFSDKQSQINTINTTLSDKASKTTDFQNSLVSNGYYKLPNGLIIQWCSSSVALGGNATGNSAGTFPIAFPNACFYVGGSPVPSVDNNAVYLCGSSKTTTSFTLTWHTSTAQTITCFVFSIGY